MRIPHRLAALLVLVLLTVLPPTEASAASHFDLLSEHDLPGNLGPTTDIAWADPASRTVYLATGRRSIVQLNLKTGDVTEVDLPIPAVNRIASSRAKDGTPYLAAAAPLNTLHWRRLGGDNANKEPSPVLTFPSHHRLDQIAALDIDADGRLLILGSHRGRTGAVMPDGAFAWILDSAISADEGPDLDPVYTSQDGPGAKSFKNCGALEISAARFLPDGGFVIVPGVEKGVYHYQQDGKLQQQWSNEDLGIDGGCDLGERESYMMQWSLEARAQWRNGHTVVDEILPFRKSPALIVRHARGAGVRWRLVLLGDGETETEEVHLPVASESGGDLLRGDVAVVGDEGEEEIVLLRFDYAEETSPGVVMRLRLVRE